jgi:hypothetical protein
LGIAAGGVPMGSELWRQLSEAGWNYFQRLNFFYWGHRLVQWDIVRQVPGSEMEFGCRAAGGTRADVCRWASSEFGEVKPGGAAAAGARQLEVLLEQLNLNGECRIEACHALSGSDWPQGNTVSVGVMAVQYKQAGPVYPGVYEWGWTGGRVPVWNTWRVTEREKVRQQVSAPAVVSSPGLPWGAIGAGALVGIGWLAKTAIDGATCLSSAGAVCPI